MKLLENSSFEALSSRLCVETGESRILGRWGRGGGWKVQPHRNTRARCSKMIYLFRELDKILVGFVAGVNPVWPYLHACTGVQGSPLPVQTQSFDKILNSKVKVLSLTWSVRVKAHHSPHSLFSSACILALSVFILALGVMSSNRDYGGMNGVFASGS